MKNYSQSNWVKIVNLKKLVTVDFVFKRPYFDSFKKRSEKFFQMNFLKFFVLLS